MKKAIIAVIAALGMISATVSFADALNGTAAKIASEKTAKSKLAAIDVLVINRTYDLIQVQNGPTVYMLQSGDTLRLPSNYGVSVPLFVSRAYDGAVLLPSVSVCGRMIVTFKTVYNRVMRTLDDEQCYH